MNADKLAQFDEILDYLRHDGFLPFGNEGDRMVWSTSETVIRALRRLAEHDAQPANTDAEQQLKAAGVFKGEHGLRGLLDAKDFWENQPYGTRLYYGDGIADYLHRGVLKTVVSLLDAQPVQAAQPWTEAEKSHMKAAAELVAEREALAQAMAKFVCSVGLVVESAKQSTKNPNACFVDWRDVCALRGEVARIRAMLTAPQPPAQPSADAASNLQTNIETTPEAIERWADVLWNGRPESNNALIYASNLLREIASQKRSLDAALAELSRKWWRSGSFRHAEDLAQVMSATRAAKGGE